MSLPSHERVRAVGALDEPPPYIHPDDLPPAGSYLDGEGSLHEDSLHGEGYLDEDSFHGESLDEKTSEPFAGERLDEVTLPGRFDLAQLRRHPWPRVRRPRAVLSTRERLRLRWAAARHRGRARLTTRRLLGAAIVIILLFTATQAIQQSRRVSAGLGNRQAIVVAVRDLNAGATIGPGDVALQEWPTALIPVGAITEPNTVLGQTTRQVVGTGEPLNHVDVGPGRFGLLADEVAVTVAATFAAPPAAIGDSVALYAVGASETPLGVEVDASLLGEGRLLAATEDSFTVAAPTSLVPAILRAQASGTVEVILLP